MTERGLPRVLYVGDVPVEASHHGSALLYRVLEQYPPDRLRVVETGEPSRADRRLAGVNYSGLPIGRRRWLNTRLHNLYSSWLSLTASSRVRHMPAIVANFDPAVIVTVGHGYGWLLAAEFAQHMNVPLHLIVHDDWPRLGGIVPILRGWLERRFAKVYRKALTRLCVSPFMAEEYQRRYGAAGSVLYPSRSGSCPVFEAKPSRAIQEPDQMVIGYGGNSGPEMMACLRDLAGALADANARMLVFGSFGGPEQQRLLAISPSLTFHGFVSHQEMIARLRAEADVLFVPMAFDAAARDNMIVSFPSKLADYTAVGLPILVYGPPYSSAIRWAGMYDPVAEVVDIAGPAGLGTALRRLKGDSPLCQRLSERALAVGAACFSAESGRASFYAAVTAPSRDEATVGATVA